MPSSGVEMCQLPLSRGGKQSSSHPSTLHSHVWTQVCLRSQKLCFTVTQQVCLNSSCWCPSPAVPSLATTTGSLCTATSVSVWTCSLTLKSLVWTEGSASKQPVCSLEGGLCPLTEPTNQITVGDSFLFQRGKCKLIYAHVPANVPALATG